MDTTTNDPTTTEAKLANLRAYVEPLVEVDEGTGAVLALIADTLTLAQTETLGFLIEDVRHEAELRGEKRGRRDLLNSVMHSSALDVLRERPDATDAELAAETGVGTEVFAEARERIGEAEKYLANLEGTD